MAKNTLNSSFRKIDVDQYCEENDRDDDGDQGMTIISTGPDESTIHGLLNQGRNVDALKLVLNNAPLGSKNQQIKETALNLAVEVMKTIKLNKIDEAIAELNREQIDILMKYIYKGFENGSEKISSHLLQWHEKAFNVGGLGSIMRVLTDKKAL